MRGALPKGASEPQGNAPERRGGILALPPELGQTVGLAVCWRPGKEGRDAQGPKLWILRSISGCAQGGRRELTSSLQVCWGWLLWRQYLGEAAPSDTHPLGKLHGCFKKQRASGMFGG